MRILKLTLTKKWFDEIYLLRKPEEYRAIKPYWNTRLLSIYSCDDKGRFTVPIDQAKFKSFDAIEFTNGYGGRMPKMLIECKGISIGRGNPEWGAPVDEDVFILKLGKILETKNIKS
jgi:hypothetical protein